MQPPNRLKGGARPYAAAHRIGRCDLPAALRLRLALGRGAQTVCAFYHAGKLAWPEEEENHPCFRTAADDLGEAQDFSGAPGRR